MSILIDYIDALTTAVLNGSYGLDEALANLEHWLDTRIAGLADPERQAFSATLDQETTNDNRSLIDSILKLHTARLLHRYDFETVPSPDEVATDYARALNEFESVLQRSEELINEARIDIAIANAHHLLGNITANRQWLDSALTRLNDLAAIDLVAMAHNFPPMPPQQVGWSKRFALRLLGINLNRLEQHGRGTRTLIGHMQNNQIVVLAHLLGTSYEAIRERSRARRAFRVAAHIIVRQGGMPGEEPAHIAEIAESLRPFEVEAADVLVAQTHGN